MDYEGWCWPGAAYYPNFLNPQAQEYYASLYSLDTFNVAWTWNDMDEPSLFNGPEITMSKDSLHYGRWEHREVHNMYGMAHLQCMFSGHLKRSNGQLRPFILARAFSAGSQRFGIWPE
ncbi:hypothetical protein RvY_01879-5 [Ramazzottius varieornatus]|uniref:Glycoside hydrolase family 31 TIM barrel domain-containing protein n=1 Tax=Ramazzottius varieornatus TaxID=947166 RepID=A0A1D1UPW9_RAMVA|nr:hypothetical protein RvY_01879-5 [Ramazzottius varieornatus]